MNIKNFVGLLLLAYSGAIADASNEVSWKADRCQDYNLSQPIAKIEVDDWRPGNTKGTIQLHYRADAHREGIADPVYAAFVLVPTLDQKVTLTTSTRVMALGGGQTYYEKLGGSGEGSSGSGYWTADIAIPANTNRFVYSTGFICDFSVESKRLLLSWKLASKIDDDLRRTTAPLMVSNRVDKSYEYSAVELNDYFGNSGIAIRLRFLGLGSQQSIALSWKRPKSSIPDLVVTNTIPAKGIFQMLNGLAPLSPSGIIQSYNLGQQDALIWIPKSSYGTIDANFQIYVNYSYDGNTEESELSVESQLPVFGNYKNFIEKATENASLTVNEKFQLALGLWLRGEFADGGFRIRTTNLQGANDLASILVKIFDHTKVFPRIEVDPNVIDLECSAFGAGYSRVGLESHVGLPKDLSEARAYETLYRLYWSRNVDLYSLDKTSKLIEPIEPCLASECYNLEMYQATLSAKQWLSIFNDGVWVKKNPNDDEDEDVEDLSSAQQSFKITVLPVDPLTSKLAYATTLSEGKDLHGYLDERVPYIRPHINLDVHFPTADDPKFSKRAIKWVNGDASILPVANPNTFRFALSTQTIGAIRSDSYSEQELSSIPLGGAIVENSRLLSGNSAQRDFDITLPKSLNPIEKDEFGAIKSKRSALVVSKDGVDRYILPWQYYPNSRIYYLFYGGRTADENAFARGIAQLNSAVLQSDLKFYAEVASLSQLPITGGQDNATDWVERAFRWSTGKPYLRNFYGINGEYDDSKPPLGEALDNDTIGFVVPLKDASAKGNYVGTSWIERKVSNSNDITYSIRPNSNRFYSNAIDEVFDVMYSTHYSQSNGYLLAHQARRSAGLRYALPKWAVVSSNVIQDLSLVGDFIKGVRIARAAKLAKVADHAAEGSAKLLGEIAEKADLGAIKVADKLIREDADDAVRAVLAKKFHGPPDNGQNIRGMISNISYDRLNPYSYENAGRQLYSRASRKECGFVVVRNGKIELRYADDIASISGQNIAAEFKCVKRTWAKSLMNPVGGKNARRNKKFAEMLEQAEAYQLSAFDKVIYHSNDLELCKFYKSEFAKRGFSKIEWVYLR